MLKQEQETAALIAALDRATARVQSLVESRNRWCELAENRANEIRQLREHHQRDEALIVERTEEIKHLRTLAKQRVLAFAYIRAIWRNDQLPSPLGDELFNAIVNDTATQGGPIKPQPAQRPARVNWHWRESDRAYFVTLDGKLVSRFVSPSERDLFIVELNKSLGAQDAWLGAEP